MVAAPAVRVGVLERLAVPQVAALVQRLLDPRVRLEHALAREQLHVVQEVAARAHGRVDVEAVGHAGGEVVGPVPRRRVHRARALLQRHVGRQHADRVAIVERVAEPQPLEIAAREARDGVTERPLHLRRHALGQPRRHDHGPPVDLVRPVLEVGVERDGEVRRDRPRRRRPDQDGEVAAAGQLRHTLADLDGRIGGERELDEDRRRGVVLVLDLGFRQGGPAVDAPVHRLLALVDHPLLDELRQRPDDGRLVAVVHRQVGFVPPPHDAEALEVLPHDVHEPGGVGPAGPAEVADRQVALLRAEFAVHLQLDRQAVAVPARDVRRVEPGHGARADDEVLEHLVEGRPQVDAPVGVRRAVVEDELRGSRAAGADPAVEVGRVPPFDRLGFRGRQVRLHGEPRPRQVERLLPVGHKSVAPSRNRNRDPFILHAGRDAGRLQL